MKATSLGRLRSGIEPEMLVLAALVGVLGGLAGVGFRLAADWVQLTFLGGVDLIEAALAMPWWKRLLIPTAGAAIASILLYVIGREKETAGVSDLMETVSLRRGTGLRLRTTVLRSLASLGIISTGGSVGREGAITQLTAAMGAETGRRLGLTGQRFGLLLGCGVAAGMAAAYNAPLAGAIFAMELILSNFAVDIFAPVVFATVSATTVSRRILGAAPVYDIPGALEIGNLPVAVLASIALGILAGFVAAAFLRTLFQSEDLFRSMKMPPYVKTTLGGLAIGVLGIWWPHVWGNGYQVVDLILHGELTVQFVALLFLLKIVATAITVGSGGLGGVFTPTLFVGAALGMVFGTGIHALLPGLAGDRGTYVMVGMAGLVAGTTQAPIMAIFVLIEITDSFEMVVPLMLGSIAASVTSNLLSGESIYTGRLKRRGVTIPEGIEELALAATRVRDVMRGDPASVRMRSPFVEVLPVLVGTRSDAIYVVDEAGRLQGAIRLHDVKHFLSDEELGQIVVAADLAVEVPFVTPDRSLAEVLQTFEDPELEEVPVVATDDDRRLIGIVGRRDVIAALTIEVLRSHSLRAKFVSREGGTADYVELPRGHRVERVPVPARMVGRTIGDVDFRRLTGLSILTVIRADESSHGQRFLPEATLELFPGDAFVVMGPGERIDAYRSQHLG
jgi:CIC family chloride channel protein